MTLEVFYPLLQSVYLQSVSLTPATAREFNLRFDWSVPNFKVDEQAVVIHVAGLLSLLAIGGGFCRWSGRVKHALKLGGQNFQKLWQLILS